MDKQRDKPFLIAAFTKEGIKTARRIQAVFSADIHVPMRHGCDGLHVRTAAIGTWTANYFRQGNVLIYIGALGIAVRAIAPFIRDKATDPAVLCIDEGGRFVIPVLSGHLGGANAYAAAIAHVLGAQAIVTTASDGRGLVAVDEWARRRHFTIENPDTIVHIASAILEGHPVGFLSEREISDPPDGIIKTTNGKNGVYIGTKTDSPFQKTLWVRPRILTIGIGCKRNIFSEQIEQAIHEFLNQYHYSIASVARLASIDQKKNEKGILNMAKKYDWAFVTHSAEELMQLPNQEMFSASEFVQKTVGVDCVCERAACMHGELTVRKTVFAGITLALAEERGERF